MTSIKLSVAPITNATAARVSHAALSLYSGPRSSNFAASRTASCLLVHRSNGIQNRQFSSTPKSQLKVKQWFPRTDGDKIKYAGPAWRHPVYSEEAMQNIEIAHRDAKTWQDKFALSLMRLARIGMDTATGYAEDPKPGPDGKPARRWFNMNRFFDMRMTERKWLIRIIFLESVAGVPGMVGGMLRHLHSLRRMKRDNGWIETLLEEAYNERMHLLTFLKIAEPGWFMKVMILAAQGVFFNGMFFSYLISPRTCHRFVGYLEEEAVYTYSRIIKDIEDGKLPEWADPKYQIPDIAVTYWNMPENKRTMKDLMMYVRADEAKHREVNHTLGNLEQENDPNPFISTYEDPSKPHPTKGIENIKPTGWERDEVI